MKVGETITVIDRSVSMYPLTGEIVELDEHPLGESYAKLHITNTAAIVPDTWVNLRLARNA